LACPRKSIDSDFLCFCWIVFWTSCCCCGRRLELLP
jgi:hypothetical protein